MAKLTEMKAPIAMMKTMMPIWPKTRPTISVSMPPGTNADTDLPVARKTLDAIGPDRMVVLTTVHGRFARAEEDNAALRELVKGRPNVRLADWDAALKGTSGQLQSDGIHPSLKGSHLFAKTVRQALADLSEERTGKTVVLKELPGP